MLKGQKMSDEQKEKIRQSNLGKKHNISEGGLESLRKHSIGGWNKGKKSSKEWIEKVRLARLGKTTSDKQKTLASLNWLGENNPNWKGGKEFWKESEKKHESSKYMYWMRSVKNRDGWKCKISNKDCEGRLEAHHILPWRDYPELRYDINNGISLCHYHHPKKYKEYIYADEFRKLIQIIQ